MQFNRGENRRFQKPIPVKEGQEYDVTIESIGEKGDGIAKVEGYVIIVPSTRKGEKVKVKVNAVRGKVSFAEVVERLGEAEPSEKEEETEESEDEEDEELEEEDAGLEEETEDEPSEEEINEEEK